jgi:hypothetical protein
MRISLRHKKSVMKRKQGLKQCGVDDDQSDTHKLSERDHVVKN